MDLDIVSQSQLGLKLGGFLEVADEFMSQLQFLSFEIILVKTGWRVCVCICNLSNNNVAGHLNIHSTVQIYVALKYSTIHITMVPKTYSLREEHLMAMSEHIHLSFKKKFLG